MSDTAHDAFEHKVEELRKRGIPPVEAYTRAHQQNPGLYALYVQQRRQGISSRIDRTAEAHEEAVKASQRPQPAEAAGPAQRIVQSLCKMEIATGRVQTEAEALPLIRAKYPQAVIEADVEGWHAARR